MTASFGIDRLGLISAKYPKVCLLFIAMLMPFFIYGATKLEFTSDVREIFRSKTPEFATLERIAAEYPTTEREITVVVQGENVLAPASLEHLRALRREITELRGVEGVLSIFDATSKPGPSGATSPLIPSSADATRALDPEGLREQALRNPLIGGKFISPDGSLTLLSVALTGNERTIEEAREIVQLVREKTRAFEAASGLSAQLTGLTVMRLEIIEALTRDQDTFRIAAVVVAVIASWLFFRKFTYVLIVAAPAAVAITWLLGSLWFAGQDMNILTNVAPTIVMVIVFSDSVHMLFAISRNLRQGQPLERAVSNSVRNVGPACVLTSITTMLALSSLFIVAHPFIAQFGLTAAAGVVLALVSTLLVVPALAVLLLGKVSASDHQTANMDRWLQAASNASAKAALAAPVLLSAIAIMGAIIMAWLYAYNEPRYRYSDNLPTERPAYQALEAIEAKLGGANTLKVLIEWPSDHDMAAPETVDLIEQVDNVIGQESIFSASSSLHQVLDWVGAGTSSALVRLALQKLTNSELGEGVISPSATSALVTAQFADLPANQLVPVLDRVEARLAELEEQHGDVSIMISGIAIISARASYEMIHELNNSLLTAIGLIIGLIGIGFRSLVAGVASILPNILPLLAGGLYLYATGEGLQFTALIAFTIGFGLAVDSTIHLLNRYTIERRGTRNCERAIRDALRHVGPVVIVSTTVVMAGLGATLTSELPMLQLYGAVVVVVLGAAFVADMILLPAMIITMERVMEGLRRRFSMGAHADENS